MTPDQRAAKIIEDSLLPLIEAAYQAGKATDMDDRADAERDLAEAHGHTKGTIWALVTRRHG